MSKSNRSTEFSDVDLGSDQESDTGRTKGHGSGPGIERNSAFDLKKLGIVMKNQHKLTSKFDCKEN